jgi:hypothetical protein
MRLATIAAIAMTAVSWPPGAEVANAAPRDRAAAVINGNDNAQLHLVHASGSTLEEEGPAYGALPGSIRAYLTVGSVFTGTVILDTRYGEITARGSARPSGSGRYQSFAGTLVIVGGKGRYAHAHGSGRLYGVFDRRTYNLTVQTRGTFSY